jgi:hypothetical protein
MGDQREENQPVERGAAEDAAGSPVTPTEVAASRRPPSEPAGPDAVTDDSSGVAGGSSGGSGGGSTTPGHPDVA